MKTVPYPEEARSIEIGMPHPFTIEFEARVIVWLALYTQGNILEVGCANGCLTRALAQAATEKTVYALDWTHNPNLIVHQAAEKPGIVASNAIHLPNVIAIDGDSKRFAYPSGISFVFVDGDHTYEGVKADTDKAMLYGPQIIAWHDFREESEWMGVYRLLNEMVNDGVDLVHVEGTPIIVKGWPA
jgi:precorrin-6B methylase 2